jgi:hypothetical protein
LLTGTQSAAQYIGKHAEMNRLEQQADDLAAQSDPEGAALAIGKAAMMAELLTQEAPTAPTKTIFQAASHLYRAQELGLRALALFQRTGGTPPPPAGVCQYLDQANLKLDDSKDFLENIPVTSPKEKTNGRDHFLKKTEDWESLLQGLQEDFECYTTSNQ